MKDADEARKLAEAFKCLKTAMHDAGFQDSTKAEVVKSLVFGRDSSCDVRVNDDQYVSPRHIRISELANGTFVIQDIGSTNGTYLNGRKIYSRTILVKGDIVQIGRTSFKW